jgi:hypothetical protein
MDLTMLPTCTLQQRTNRKAKDLAHFVVTTQLVKFLQNSPLIGEALVCVVCTQQQQRTSTRIEPRRSSKLRA